MNFTMTRSGTTVTTGAPNTPPGSPGGGGGGNNGPDAHEAVTAVEANIFGLTPASVQSVDIINYSSSQGIKLYHAAVAALKIMYTLESVNMNQSNEALMQRASESDWDAAGADILKILDRNGTRRNVISEYDFLSAQDIQDHMSTYHTMQTR
jgi:tagatose-1,6-bisphosphate aldolase